MLGSLWQREALPVCSSHHRLCSVELYCNGRMYNRTDLDRFWQRRLLVLSARLYLPITTVTTGSTSGRSKPPARPTASGTLPGKKVMAGKCLSFSQALIIRHSILIGGKLCILLHPGRSHAFSGRNIVCFLWSNQSFPV